MTTNKWSVRMVSVAVFSALALPVGAQTSAEPTTVAASVATFSDLKDAVPGRWFDASATGATENLRSAVVPNRLSIRFNTGTDPKTWKSNAFIASSNAFYHASVMDTIGFTIKAPEGSYIARITYAQRGTGSIARTGKISGGATWIVGTTAAPLGIFGTNPTLTGTMDLTDQFLTVVPVSITVGLHAFSTPTLGSATVSLSGAEVDVELLPLPSAKLFGSTQ